MSDVSRAQKIRLGIFLFMAALLIAALVIYKLGGALFAEPDHYTVRIADGVGGLQAGADVTYNGIVIGQVSDVKVDPVDVAMVRLELELAEGTPIPENTTATVVLQGITGGRRVDLMGGTNGVRLRKAGEEIPAGRGLFDELLEKAEQISAKVDVIADQVTRLGSDENIERIEGTLANAERASLALAGLLEDSRPRMVALLDTAGSTTAELGDVLVRAKTTMTNLDRAIASAEGLISKDVRPLIGRAAKVMERIDGVVGKVDGAVADAAKVMQRVDTVVGRTSGDVQRVLVELADGIGSIAELADMLSRDPSSLIQGRTWEGR